MANRMVYSFGDGKAQGKAEMKNLLGGKGANLAEMNRIGLPVPAGFSITTEVCTYYTDHKGKYPQGLVKDVDAGMKKIEKIMGAKFGDAKNPLLISVRSGARASMPGMMDTVLNLGLNEATLAGLIEKTGNERFAWDAYRRFVAMYGDVVLDLKPQSKTEVDPFEEIIEDVKKKRKVKDDLDLTVDDLKTLVTKFKAAIKKKTGKPFPDDPKQQLWGAIGAVFGSWNNPRAIEYRRLYDIPYEWGTAVNVQAMVFGNMGDDCATGVGFSRNPANGEKKFFGEYLVNAQGEDVVAGIRTPQPIEKMKTEMPKLYRELDGYVKKLEKHYKDMQDIEFTIQNGKLWMLQTRSGKRTGFAACIIAVDKVREKLSTDKEALLEIDPNSLDQLLAPIFDTKEKDAAIAKGALAAQGLPAGPGAASGRVVFHADDAEPMAKKGDGVILVRIETSPDDIKGMKIANGILTERGGMTSHAALVARQMGKVCVAGCTALSIDYKKQQMKVAGKIVKAGDFISLDGSAGQVLFGRMQTMPSEVKQALFGKGAAKKKAAASKTYKAFKKLMVWSDKYRTMGVRTNADQPNQAADAVEYGAEGIGLCRTEHMFFGGDRIDWVRRMILADGLAEREKALKKLLPMQRKDFAGLFVAMKARPVTIRLLDPPLHEFLPHTQKDISALAKQMGVSTKKLTEAVEDLHEFNPMLGHRGCRLGISMPEIYKMQVRAIVEAACDVRKKKRIKANVEIMIPLVATKKELAILRGEAEEVIAEVFAKKKMKFDILIGTMIELPRAAVAANEIAEVADFFSFGTNDLTQTTFGLSRDDAGKFLPTYVERDILPSDPFVTIDFGGVGQLVQMGTERGRSTRKNLKVGICGEHGGDPASVKFCHRTGLNYVSCSPPRVPVARMAAAQAALEGK
jgi:pyruvate, orthophosphate dikinase